MVIKVRRDKVGKHIVVSGHVQGVGFRFKIQQKARQYGLVGWVRNNEDGKVEMEIAGSEKDMKRMLNDVFIGIERVIHVYEWHINNTDYILQDYTECVIVH